MINEFKIRYYIMVGWLIAFTAMWFIFDNILPQEELLRELQSIEVSIQKENWQDAENYMKQFKQIVEDKRIVINSNNSTEAHSNFENMLGQLDLAIKYKEDDALEYIGGLRNIIMDLTQAFAGP